MFSRRRIRGLFFILAGAGLGVGTFACSKAKEKPKGPVVARVGEYPITLDDLRSRLAETPAAYRQYSASPEGRRQFLSLLVREKLLLAEAKKLNIPRDPTYKEAVAKFKSEWKRRLKEYEETVQVESALRRLRSKDLAASDTEVDQYYTDHRSDFEKPIEVTASHILVTTQIDAEAALARLKAKEPFEKVAKAMSKDPATAVRGGKLTPFRRGMLVPEFEEAAYALKVGQTSGIVKSQFGFHIIKKLSEKQLPPRSPADVKEEIRAKLERDKFNQWVTAKEAALGVKVNEQVLSQWSTERAPIQ